MEALIFLQACANKEIDASLGRVREVWPFFIDNRNFYDKFLKNAVGKLLFICQTSFCLILFYNASDTAI